MVIKHTYVFIIHLKSRLTKATNFDYFFPPNDYNKATDNI